MLCLRKFEPLTKVSIPFKRESGSKVYQKGEVTSDQYTEFQFPSNGKADPKMWLVGITLNGGHPVKFQFPSNGKADPKVFQSLPDYIEWKAFQFPSNGKADPKQSLYNDPRQCFGDAFQFPSNGKADPKETIRQAEKRALYSFNSLQTGKRIQRMMVLMLASALLIVSIPFKRESGSKVPTEHEDGPFYNKFQFPSNGKADPKVLLREQGRMLVDGFQFPSNGKADPKADLLRTAEV